MFWNNGCSCILWNFTLTDNGYFQFFNMVDKQELKEKLLSATSDLDFSALAADALPFLINPDGQEAVLNFRKYIEQKLG